MLLVEIIVAYSWVVGLVEDGDRLAVFPAVSNGEALLG